MASIRDIKKVASRTLKKKKKSSSQFSTIKCLRANVQRKFLLIFWVIALWQANPSIPSCLNSSSTFLNMQALYFISLFTLLPEVHAPQVSYHHPMVIQGRYYLCHCSNNESILISRCCALTVFNQTEYIYSFY